MTKDKDNDKKKPMRVKGVKKEPPKKPKPNILTRLYNNTRLRSKVDNALDEGRSYDYIIELCAEYDLEISSPSLSRYKDKRNEAIEKDIDLGELIDKRKRQGNVIELSDKESDITIDDEKFIGFGENMNKVEKIYSDLEIIDKILIKANNTIDLVETVDLPLALKAMEMKAKLTNNQLQGLSLAALKEIKIRQVAKESAMIETIMEHVPEEKHDTILEAMREKEQQFYDSMDLSDEGKRLMDSLETTEFKI